MQVEDVVTISSKGQIVIPKRVRERLGLKTGGKLLVATTPDNREILLKTTDTLTLEEISTKTSRLLAKEGLDAHTLADEAVERARAKKRRRNKRSRPSA